MYKLEQEAVVKLHETESQSLESFIGAMELRIINRTEDVLEFDLLNAHPSLANALRRVLIAEVPSLAIHDVSIRENDTVFPDEYIAHRLGLIPIAANMELIEMPGDEANAANTAHFTLVVRNDTKEVLDLYSDSIIWCPVEGQEHWGIQLKPGVLICKMAPGNTIDMSFTARKGVGMEHAKWSPVSLCSYRLMPRIELHRDFYGEDAMELQSLFSEGVIGISDGKAVVINPRLEMMSREALRHDKFKDAISIFRESNWFCFTIETISQDPLYLLRLALKILIEKCKDLKTEVKNIS